jgi:hypothetical protein
LSRASGQFAFVMSRSGKRRTKAAPPEKQTSLRTARSHTRAVTTEPDRDYISGIIADW